MKSAVKRTLISLLPAIILLEVTGHIIKPETLMDFTLGGEESYSYEYDSELGWFPLPNKHYAMRTARRVENSTNSLGFRDSEWGLKLKPRILFIGDSFIWGSDVEARERFSDLLRGMLPNWQVITMGVAGYGNDQEYLMLQRYFNQADPDIVFLLFVGLNDLENNQHNFFYGNFKPYFQKDYESSIHLEGVPVKKSLAYDLREFVFPFRYSYVARGIASIVIHSMQTGRINIADPSVEIISAMRNFVESRDRLFLMGYESIDNDFLVSLQQAGLNPLNLVTDLRYPGFAWHWTPEGHSWVASEFCDYFDSLSVDITSRGLPPLRCSTERN